VDSSRQSPVVSHQSPVVSHQSPVISHQSPVISRRFRVLSAAALLFACVVSGFPPPRALEAMARARAQPSASTLPALTKPVNDFAQVIDSESAAEMDRIIRALQAATGDVVVVVTVPTVEPYGDIREYAVKLFENQGRGIGEKGKDNGLLILLALKERRVWIEVGYGLEQWITDGFSGETSREVMAPELKNGRYGPGLLAGTRRTVGRIAQGRNVTLEGVPAPRAIGGEPSSTPTPFWLVIVVFIIILLISRGGGGPRRRNRYWGGGPWSGWSSGVGPFGGGWGGGFGGGSGGGGFGGGFGGFGGGRSGGGGGGASW
jgi:uncharacterized protein